MTPPTRDDAATSDWWLGMDIGGTQLKLGVVDTNGGVTRERTEATEHEPFERVWELLLAYASEMAADDGLGRLRGAGVAAPGIVDRMFGVRNLPGKVPGIEDFPLRERLENALGVPVRCVNDGSAATLAEWRFGAAAGYHDVVGFTIGTGLGCGVIIDDRLLVSRNLGAGAAFGHATIESGGRTCLCGNIGCAETLVSANAVVGQARDYVARRVPSTLTDRFESDLEALSFRDIIDARILGDRVAEEIVAAFTQHLGATVVTAIHAYDPEVVVLAGGPMAAADQFLPKVQEYVDTYSFRYPKDRVIPVRRAEHSTHAGVLGAVALVIQAAAHGRRQEILS